MPPASDAVAAYVERDPDRVPGRRSDRESRELREPPGGLELLPGVDRIAYRCDVGGGRGRSSGKILLKGRARAPANL
jgi:hypothetical protein